MKKYLTKNKATKNERKLYCDETNPIIILVDFLICIFDKIK